MSEWFKEWEKVGFTSDLEFMLHSGNEYDSPGRLFVRKFIVEKKISYVVEVGCGPLIDLECIIKDNILLKGYTAYDVNKYEKWKHLNIPSWASVHCMESPYKIKEPDEKFELVYTRHTLEHQEDHIEFIKELKRICKNYLIIVFFLPPANSEIHKNEMWMRFYGKTYSKKLLIEEFKNEGLHLLETHEYFTNHIDVVWVLSPRGFLDKKSW